MLVRVINVKTNSPAFAFVVHVARKLTGTNLHLSADWNGARTVVTERFIERVLYAFRLHLAEAREVLQLF